MTRLITLLLLLPLLAHAQSRRVLPMLDFLREGCPTLTVPVYLINYDGSNDYLSRGSALTGLADAKTFTCSFWIDLNGGDGSAQIIQKHGAAGAGIQISRNTSNLLELEGYNAAAAQILSATSSITLTAASGWVHVYAAIDMANAANRHIYFNGTEDAGVTWTTFTDDTIDLNTASVFCRLGSADGATAFANACVAEYWFDDTYFNDVTKFREAGTGAPMSLGSTGQTPTGSSPVFYLSLTGSGSSWAFDSSANANNFTANGNPEAGACYPPYQYCTDQIAANTAFFDGNDQFNLTTLAGIADTKVVTLSTWVKFTASDGVSKKLFSIDSDNVPGLRFGVTRNAANTVTIEGRNAVPAVILDATSSFSLTIASCWVHIYIAIDLANSANRHIYFNGVEDTGMTWTTYSNDTLDLITASATSTEIGANRNNLEVLTGNLAEFWFNDVYFNDPTKFRCSANHPIGLGATGDLPTGTAPAVYLSLRGAANTWSVDVSGNGNTFTITGGPLGFTTSP